MKFIEILGLVAGMCTSSALIPQIVTTIKKKKSEDVAIHMFIIMLTGNALWIYYGIVKADVAIIATNVLALSLNITMLVLKAKYG